MNTQLRNKPEINKHSLTFGKWCVDLVDFFILFVHKVELFFTNCHLYGKQFHCLFRASPKKHRLRGCKCCQKPRRAVLPKSHDFAASWPSCRSRSDAKGWSYEFIGSYMIKLCISMYFQWIWSLCLHTYCLVQQAYVTYQCHVFCCICEMFEGEDQPRPLPPDGIAGSRLRRPSCEFHNQTWKLRGWMEIHWRF